MGDEQFNHKYTRACAATEIATGKFILLRRKILRFSAAGNFA